MNKKIISIICATVLTLCAVVGGVVFTGMQTIASGAQMTVSVESPTVGKDDEVRVLVTASSGEAMTRRSLSWLKHPPIWPQAPTVKSRLLKL